MRVFGTIETQRCGWEFLGGEFETVRCGSCLARERAQCGDGALGIERCFCCSRSLWLPGSIEHIHGLFERGYLEASRRSLAAAMPTSGGSLGLPHCLKPTGCFARASGSRD